MGQRPRLKPRTTTGRGYQSNNRRTSTRKVGGGYQGGKAPLKKMWTQRKGFCEVRENGGDFSKGTCKKVDIQRGSQKIWIEAPEKTKRKVEEVVPKGDTEKI